LLKGARLLTPLRSPSASPSSGEGRGRLGLVKSTSLALLATGSSSVGSYASLRGALGRLAVATVPMSALGVGGWRSGVSSRAGSVVSSWTWVRSGRVIEGDPGAEGAPGVCTTCCT
jgi:hypothetical protein